MKEPFLLRRRRKTNLGLQGLGEEEEDPPSPPLEMKDPFLLRRRRKTHLLADNIGTDPYIAPCQCFRGGGMFRNESPPLPYLGEEASPCRIPLASPIESLWHRPIGVVLVVLRVALGILGMDLVVLVVVLVVPETVLVLGIALWIQ